MGSDFVFGTPTFSACPTCSQADPFQIFPTSPQYFFFPTKIAKSPLGESTFLFLLQSFVTVHPIRRLSCTFLLNQEIYIGEEQERTAFRFYISSSYALSLCGLCQSFDTSRQNHFTALDDIWQKRCKSPSSNFIAKDADWNVLQHPHVLQLRRVPFRHHFMLFSPSSHHYIYFERQRTRKNEGLRKNYGATNFSRSKLISASFHSLTHTQSCRNTHLSRANKDNGDHFYIKNKIDLKQIT